MIERIIIHKSWANAIMKMSNAQAGQVIQAMVAFANGDEEAEPDDQLASLVFSIIKEEMREDG